MDRHLARLERLLGGPLRARVFWVRGPLPRLGLTAMSVHGIAVGSGASPPDWDGGEGTLDRHELAHAALDHFRTPGSDPPYVLHEGWAEARSREGGTRELVRTAVEVRAQAPSLRVRDLLGPDWYHRDLGPVYSLGGAFVDHLIRTQGMAKFLRFFNECRPDTFEATCRDVFGADPDVLEARFWEDARQQLSGPG
jgi:hypothetical protein